MNNTVDEPDQTITISATVTEGRGIRTPQSLELTIKDDDGMSPDVALVLTPSRVREGLASAVTAVASGPLADETAIRVSASPGHTDTSTDDYLLSTNKVLTIPAGATRSTGTVTIATVDDQLSSGRRRRVATVSGTVTDGGVANPADQTLTILEDELRVRVSLMATPATIVEGREEGKTSTITMRSLQPVPADVTVTVTESSDAAELSAEPVLMIAAGETESTGLVTLTAVDDADMSNEVVSLLGSPSPDSQFAHLWGTSVYILDDDVTSTRVTVSPVPANVFEGESSTVIAELSQPLADEVTVTISVDEAHVNHTAEADEYMMSANRTLTIAAGSMRSTGVVTLIASNDEYYGPLTLRRVVLDVESVSGINEDQVHVYSAWHIREDEDQPRVTLEVAPASISENGGQSTVTARLNTKVAKDVEVTISAAPVGTTESDDFTQTGTQLTIPADGKASTGTVSISAVDDDDGPDKNLVVTGTVKVVGMETSGLVWDPYAEGLTIRDDEQTIGRPGAPRSTTLSGGLPILRYEYRFDAEFFRRPWIPIPYSAPGQANQGRYEIARPNGSYAIVYLRAVNNQGPGAEVHRGAMPFAGAPGPPGDFSATLISENEFRLSWTEPVAPPGVIITEYIIDGSPDGVTDWKQSTYNITVPGTTSMTGRVGPRRGAFRIQTRFHVETPTVVDGTEFSGGMSETSPVVRPGPGEASVDPALPQIRVWDAFAREGRDAAVHFTVRLLPAETSTVTVDYRTEDIRATAPDDYEATSGMLTFAPGETEKTVSVPVVDDAVEDSGEEFALLLSNVSGARLGDEGAIGVIYNEEDVLGSFTLMDESGTEIAALGDGTAVTLDDPANGRYGIVAQMAPNVEIGSVRLELTGAKAVTQTDNAAPYSLYGDAGGTVQGEALSAGSYTLSATAYAEANGSGDALETWTVSFTVTTARTIPGPEDDDDEGIDLTASFSGVPATHAGPGEQFTFDLSFSENPEISYKTLRDHSFTVTGGDVKKAKRKTQGSNQNWTITIELTGWGDVSLTLPGGRACTATGAICTADNRQLSNSLNATVQGPAALSVADASANESTDLALDFAVSLDRASTLTITVDFATSNGTATAGDDYTATTGTLTFSLGDVTKTVSVPILDDVVNDGQETMTLTLSNAINARIADATATGTIENSDPMPAAWAVRFGRSAASHVLDALEARLDTPPQSYVRLGGRQLGGSPDIEEAVELLAPDNNLSLWQQDEASDASGRNMTVKEVLLGSALHLVSNDDEETIGPRLSAWAGWPPVASTARKTACHWAAG